MFGQGAELKHEALDVILETTEGNQLIQQKIVSRPAKASVVQSTGSKMLDDIADATPASSVARARSKQSRSN